MKIIGVIFIAIGITLFFVYSSLKRKIESLRLARPASIAELNHLASEIALEMGVGSWRDYVKLRGTIQCDQPLMSELKQVPCVHYHTTVVREYEEYVTERDGDNNPITKTQSGSETLSQHCQSVPFFLQDDTGEIWVDPEGAQIETIPVLDDFSSEQPSGRLFSDRLPLSPSLETNWQIIGFRYQESVLPVQYQVFVVAQVSDFNQSLILENPTTKGQRFLISLKSEGALAQSTQMSVTYAFYGMLSTLVVGVLLLILSLVSA
ncbi:E3 ubiquitin ligase family protein [Acaryochloris sp. IP29b_bin.137]|uniref:E3 ubiquitin ligase family protein n=1 Tax=Acaryochloris sp. IP29b_bin.137 TaxID=2969217 RepID=UPI0026113787|nr:E3 ubiquitin ligase family protein [Acaryochloris sp. IP29b_bin.137]